MSDVNNLFRSRRAQKLNSLLLGGLLVTIVSISLVAVPGPKGIFGAALGAIMLTIATIDARWYIIPNELTVTALVLSMLYHGFVAPDAGLDVVLQVTMRGLVAASPLFCLMIGYRAWRGRDGLGLGDVKLMVVAGAWLNWTTIIGVIEVAALTAIAVYASAAYRMGRKLSATMVLPFGLFLAPSIWSGWLVQTLLF